MSRRTRERTNLQNFGPGEEEEEQPTESLEEEIARLIRENRDL